MRYSSSHIPLMALSLLLLAVFLVFWVKQQLTEERAKLSAELENAFRYAVEQQQDSLIYRVVIRPLQQMPQDSVVSVFEKAKRLERRRHPIKRRRKDLQTKARKGLQDSSNIQFRFFEFSDQTPDQNRIRDRFFGNIFIAFRNQDSSIVGTQIADSISIPKLKQCFQDSLSKAKIDLKFQVEKSPWDSLTYTGPGWATRSFRADIPSMHFYRAAFPTFNMLVFKRLLPALLFSLFLLGLTALSFWMIFHSLKQQRRLASLKNDFISNMSHELKTPITTVGVALEALENAEPLEQEATRSEYLQISRSELDRLSLLVDKVLNLSMFEEKQPEIKRESLALDELIEGILQSLRLQFRQLELKIEKQFQGDDFSLIGDSIHLTNVIYNLLDNAMKYGGSDQTIKIILQREASRIRLSIQDEGPGIPDFYRERIFDRFFRVPAENLHNIKGHGLGLSYVATVVKQHGGTIENHNLPQKGTAFTLYFNVA